MIHIYPVASTINTNNNKILEPFVKDLKSENIEFNLLEQFHNRSKPFAFLILTGGSEHEIMRLAENIADPVLLIAHSEENSFPAALEILARLNQLKRKGKIILLNKKKTGYGELKKTTKIMETREKLENSKIGLIGNPSKWLVATPPDMKLITEIWGPEVIKIPVSELLEETERISEEEAIVYAREFLSHGKKSIGPGLEEIVKSVRVYMGTKKIVEKYHLQSVSIECFGLIKDLNTTGCYALSKLNDEGIIAGCEGDMAATLTMLWMYCLTGEIPFMANPQDLDIDNNILLIAHCTIARKLLKSYVIRSHFESSIGVALQGKMKKEDITLGRIGGEDLREIYLDRGKILACENSENRCRTQLKLELEKSVEYFLKNPLGNHHIMIRGHWADLLNDYYNFIIAT